jgi:SAM-dependent methyltransferase
MSPEGEVYRKKYDKFKQVNKFLEFVDGALKKTSLNVGPLRIIDFGCGKAYLTFALYHYVTSHFPYAPLITGLDLKEEVIDFCRNITEALHYDTLSFLRGDIASYEPEDKVHMVVTLHACDTATDEALLKALKWDCDVILSVPCCQHELLTQIEHADLKPILKYGILKEKMNALVTDSLRALLLEAFGYEVTVMEFIDMEHTPKNVLIRAIRKNNGFQKDKFDAFLSYLEIWHIQECYLLEGLRRYALLMEGKK